MLGRKRDMRFECVVCGVWCVPDGVVGSDYVYL